MYDNNMYRMRDHTYGDGNCGGATKVGYFTEFKDTQGFTKHRCRVCGHESFGVPLRINDSEVRYDRETLIDVLSGWTDYAEDVANEYEKQRVNGPDKACQSLVHHGPGHQSSTYCEVRGGAHDESEDGKVLHSADLLVGGYVEWTDDDPYARD